MKKLKDGCYLQAPLKIRAFLACQPEARFSAAEIYRSLNSSAPLMNRLMSLMTERGEICREEKSERKALFYVTKEQAAAIHEELAGIGGEATFWLGRKVEPRRPPKLDDDPEVPKRGRPSEADQNAAALAKMQRLDVTDPMEASTRLNYLRRIRERTIFGEDAMLKAIIADYERTLARLTGRSSA
jgi:hypothetical protein